MAGKSERMCRLIVGGIADNILRRIAGWNFGFTPEKVWQYGPFIIYQKWPGAKTCPLKNGRNILILQGLNWSA
jgi:hypothetical protein